MPSCGQNANCLILKSVIFEDAITNAFNISGSFSFFSLGIFQCGPCPVNAIRKGDVYLPYDAKFVFAEVNADRIYWLVKNVDGKEKCIKLREDTKAIGKSISTKAVGKNTREDITHQYKFPESEFICPLFSICGRT